MILYVMKQVCVSICLEAGVRLYKNQKASVWLQVS